MPHVTYRQPDGAEETIDVPVGHSVMDGAVDHGIPGIIAQCGGAATCGTCHCYIAPEWIARLPPPEPREAEMLDYLWEPRDNSRLTCQIQVTDALDGLTVDVPERQI
jgi:ferredoxin, 2Fe-2S